MWEIAFISENIHTLSVTHTSTFLFRSISDLACGFLQLMYAFSDVYYDTSRPTYLEGYIRKPSYGEGPRTSAIAEYHYEGLNNSRLKCETVLVTVA